MAGFHPAPVAAATASAAWRAGAHPRALWEAVQAPDRHGAGGDVSVLARLVLNQPRARCCLSAQQRMCCMQMSLMHHIRIDNPTRTSSQRPSGGQHTHSLLPKHALAVASTHTCCSQHTHTHSTTHCCPSCRSLHARPSASGSSGLTGELLLVASTAAHIHKLGDKHTI